MLTVTLQTDDWPEENSIVLTDDQGTLWNHVAFEANQQYVFDMCLSTKGCTVLDVTDTEGDGLLESGTLTVEWGSQVLYDDWDLGYGFFLDLGDGC